MGRPRLRDAAGTLNLVGGTGGILQMIGLPKFLEAYKVDTTFRIQTPQTVDPKNSNPNAPWVVKRIDGIGASSLAVARVFLQGERMLREGIFETRLDKEQILRQLHSCKEELVVCEQVAKRIKHKIDGVLNQIKSKGIGRENNGHALNPFPQVSDLGSNTTAFLIHAKRSIVEATALAGSVLGLDVHGSNFANLCDRLVRHIGEDEPLTQYVSEQEQTVKYIVDLRNFQEHPGKVSAVLDDFHVLPDGSVSAPILHLSNEDPQPLGERLTEVSVYLVHLTEAIFIHSIMRRLDGRWPVVLSELETSAIDPKCPIKYRLVINVPGNTARRV